MSEASAPGACCPSHPSPCAVAKPWSGRVGAPQRVDRWDITSSRDPTRICRKTGPDPAEPPVCSAPE
jgi:hypothetical protein